MIDINELRRLAQAATPGPLLFTLQRVNGKTPHQLRAEAEKERDDLRIALRHEADCVEASVAKIEALGAKIAEIERQGPVATVIKKGADRYWMSEQMSSLPALRPPRAQGE